MYDPKKHRSILEYPDPQSLLSKHAGSGKAVAGIPGVTEYIEMVNFEEYIGIYINEEGSLHLPTTWGTIHYSKKGAHIIPAYPK
jgi:hypothetical protein